MSIMPKHSNSNKQSLDPRDRFSDAQRDLLEKVKKMTPAQGVKTLVASGIYTPNGKLAPEYGG